MAYAIQPPMTQRAALQSEMDRCVAELKMLGAKVIKPFPVPTQMKPRESPQLQLIIENLVAIIKRFRTFTNELEHYIPKNEEILAMDSADIMYHYREIIVKDVLLSMCSVIEILIEAIRGIDITNDQQWMRALRGIITANHCTETLYSGIGSFDNYTRQLCTAFIAHLKVDSSVASDKKHISDRLDYIMNKLGMIGDKLGDRRINFIDIQAGYTKLYTREFTNFIQEIAAALAQGSIRHHVDPKP